MSQTAITKSTTKPYSPPPPCHKGSVDILKVGKGVLQAGGWSRGALYPEITIDLTGDSEPRRMEVKVFGTNIFSSFLKVITPNTSWLSLPVRDFGVPDYKLYEWQVLADILYKKMDKYGKTILVACQGGHGRTGMVVSILGFLMGEEEWKENPVKHLRKIYCKKAVETAAQERYVYKTLGLDIEVDEEQYKSKYSYPKGTPYKGKTWRNCSKCGVYRGHEAGADVCESCSDKEKSDSFEKTCPICKGNSGFYAQTYGMCLSCVDKAKKMIEKAKDDSLDYDAYLQVKGICVMCGEEDCYGVSMGSCGHIVHRQPATNTSSLCDKCYRDQHWKVYE